MKMRGQIHKTKKVLKIKIFKADSLKWLLLLQIGITIKNQFNQSIIQFSFLHRNILAKKYLQFKKTNINKIKVINNINNQIINLMKANFNKIRILIPKIINC